MLVLELSLLNHSELDPDHESNQASNDDKARRWTKRTCEDRREAAGDQANGRAQSSSQHRPDLICFCHKANQCNAGSYPDRKYDSRCSVRTQCTEGTSKSCYREEHSGDTEIHDAMLSPDVEPLTVYFRS